MVIASAKLRLERVIHDSDFSRVELLVDDDGNRYAKKTYKREGACVAIEKDFLASAMQMESAQLILPNLVEAAGNEIVQSFVEREHQTRESIQQREWTDAEFENFDKALREFQRIPLNASKFSFKQKAMGILYPVFKLLLNIPKLLKRKEIRLISLLKLSWLSFVYAIKRPFYKNVTVHYDLQTLNCAFTPDHRVSILDFEFPYYKGDSLFDVCYFATIPPQSIQNWTFQNEIIRRQLKPLGWTTKIRLRLILIICCQVRILFFDPKSEECNTYRETLKVLLSGKEFDAFYNSLSSEK